ncbi:kinase-like protein [Heliocybe sulcata]|uniref:Kinase-like protein n=1 Tax=Heliocybe sulcata TaxID=5364 RepID=A0A5C3N7M6_9AGAM|nr:kinase-like protein [Heliocybe sulcata]
MQRRVLRSLHSAPRARSSSVGPKSPAPLCPLCQARFGIRSDTLPYLVLLLDRLLPSSATRVKNNTTPWDTHSTRSLYPYTTLHDPSRKMRFTNVFKKMVPASREVKQVIPAASDEKEVAVVKSTPIPTSIAIPHVETEMLELLYNAYVKPEVLSVRSDLRLKVQMDVRQLSTEIKKRNERSMSIISTPKRASSATKKAPSVRSFIVRPAKRGALRVVNGSVISSIKSKKATTIYSLSSFSSIGNTTKATNANLSDTTLIPASHQPLDLRKSHHFVQKLGQGAFGVVYLIQNSTTLRFSALKVVVKTYNNKEDGEAMQRMVMNETRAMRKAQGCRFIVGLEASGHDDFGYQMVTTYCPGGDMGRELERLGCFCESRVRFYLSQMILAVEHLHKQKIVHRDIKPGNILLDARGNAVLADLGLSHVFDDAPKAKPTTDATWNPALQHALEEIDRNFDDPERYTLYQSCGTEGFMAPEILTGAGYSFGVDIWALGVTAFEMRCGRLPWSGVRDGKRDRMLMLNQCLRDPLVFDARDEVSLKLQSVIKGMLEKDPFDRVEIRELKKKPFFRNTKWKRLADGKVKPYYIPPQCLATPHNHYPALLPLGDAYAADEDPLPELTYRSPLLNEGAPGNCPAAPGVFAKLVSKMTKPKAPRVQWQMVAPKSPAEDEKIGVQAKSFMWSSW